MSTERPAEIVAALAEARELLAAQPAQAEARLRDVLRENPDEPDALLLLASALRRKGAPTSARAILEPLSQHQSHLPMVHYELGLVLGMLGDNRGATQALKYALDLDPGFAEAWSALGDQMVRMRSRKGADAAYAEYFYASVKEPVLRDAMTAYRESRLEDARLLLLEHLKTNPEDVNALKLLAEIAIKQGRMRRAEELLRRCIELAPDFVAARFRYATLLMTQNKPQEAIDQVDEILKVDDDPFHRNLKAAALIRMSDFETAAAEYAVLLKAFPNQPGAWLAYGHALKTLGRREDCIAAYRKAASLLPGLGDAYWSLANLKTYRFGDAEVETLRQQVARPDMKGENRALFCFALGKALEDLGRYEESFFYYRIGNDMVHAAGSYDPDEMRSQVRRAKTLFTQAFFAARQGMGNPSADPIFVVGLPRSGSTLIEQILSSHSAIEGTTELRALPYLAGRLGGKLKPGDPLVNYPEALASLDAANLKGLGDEYLWRARTHRRQGRAFFVDKMPNNFAHIGMLALILPNAKIVDVRRHPLACCLSNFKQHFGTGQEFSYSLGDLGRYYFDYVELMAHWDEVLPGKVHRVIYEDLVEDPEREIRRLAEYLGLPFQDSMLRFHDNTRLVRSASAEQVRRPIFSEHLDHWKHYEPWLQPLKAELGFVLESYPAVPRFYSQLHSKLDYAGWQGADPRWSGLSIQAVKPS
ncbi:MAG: sulfotransferase [Alphaproteobacteria bacterium]|nr:sulfotransferase [Alphaproteobacteria bacterium]MBV9692423.1 sulfotransferase [Alphaproteobacteria bacterium]